MTRTIELEAGPDADGERLDRWLAGAVAGMTRSHARRLIDGGHVTVDGEPARPAHRLRPGAIVRLEEPEPEPSGVEPQAIPLRILHEDEEILVLDKPAGLVIHPAAGNPDGTLVNALLHHCRGRLSGIGGVERPGIVHRLDKDTTGVMVVAKTDRAHLALTRAFQWRRVTKTYVAVVYGEPAAPEGVVDAPIGRHPRDRKRMAVVTGGRPARTLYRVVERLGGTALLHCRLVTGRTHQVRVHMAHAGHALVGDPLYAGRQWRNLGEPAASACRRFPRQALHAWRLELDHPVTGERLTFEAPLPPDIQRLLATLREAAGLSPL